MRTATRFAPAALALAALLAGLAVPPAVRADGAEPTTVHGEECVAYDNPTTGAPDLRYCVRRQFEYVFKDGEPLLVHEHIITRYTVINGQPVDCVAAEHIVIANGEIRHEKGRFTCP